MKNVQNDAIECSLCLKWCHRRCAKLSKQELATFSNADAYWYCQDCSVIFPFCSILDDEFDYINSSLDVKKSYYELYNTCKSLSEECKKKNEHLKDDFQNIINTENILDDESNMNCDYYTNDEFNCKFSNIYGLSVLHFNCRSVKANFSNLQDYILSLVKNFDIIAVTETWLNETDNVNDFCMAEYDIAYMNRKNKRGGGVMIYVSKRIKFDKVDNMSLVLDDILEVITIKLVYEKEKKYIH